MSMSRKALFDILPEALTYPEIQPKLLRQLAMHGNTPTEFRARLKKFKLI